MTQLQIRNTLGLMTFVGLLSACNHIQVQDNETRIPASAPLSDQETEASFVQNYKKFESLAHNRNANLLRILFSHIRKTQALVANFDLRLESAQQSQEVDSLLKSKLYCKILRVRTINENVEDKLIAAAQGAYASGSEGRDWFYQQLSLYAAEGTAQKAAMIQAIRVLNTSPDSICGTPNCISNDVKKIETSEFRPFDNKAFALFMKQNRRQLIVDQDTLKSDLEPGDCFDGNKREPNQSQNYNWQTRNWIGSALAPGEFIFTYDDGPHPTYSQEIATAWANARLEKPTFFWLLKNVRSFPKVAQQLSSENYILGSHSERHADLGNLARAESPRDFNSVNRFVFDPEARNLTDDDFASWKMGTLDREINTAARLTGLAIGQQVRYFRLPYGSGIKNQLIGERLQTMNLDHFFWRVDSLDWQDKNPETIRDRVFAQMRAVKSGIILFHDIHPQSVEATNLIIEEIKTNPTWKPVPISKLRGLTTRPQ